MSNEFAIGYLNSEMKEGSHSVNEVLFRNSLWFFYKVAPILNFTNKLFSRRLVLFLLSKLNSSTSNFIFKSKRSSQGKFNLRSSILSSLFSFIINIYYFFILYNLSFKSLI